MPTLTVYKTITYTDPDSDTPYTVTATKVLNCEAGQRTRFTLSSSASTQILTNGYLGLTVANPLYTAIKNVGAGSAYILFDDGTNTFLHEIPTGAIFDFFGEDIWGSGTADTFNAVHAKGNTELEVDVFM